MAKGRGYGAVGNEGGAVLPQYNENASNSRRRKIGPQLAEGESCPVPKKEKLADIPVDGPCSKELTNCCVVAKETLLSPEEYQEWLEMYLDNCKTGTIAKPDRFRELSRRLHLWRDGFTSDPTYQKIRAKYFDRTKVLSFFACLLSEFFGTFITTFFPILIIAAVPIGLFDAYGAFGPVAFAVGAFVAAAFTNLFMHGSYFEPSTTLLLYFFSDDFTIKKRRNFWPTGGRILGQLIAVFVGCAFLLILWNRGSENFERVAHIADYQNFWESPDTDNDYAGPGIVHNLGQNIFVIIMCSVFYNIAMFAIHVISHSTIIDFTPYNVITPILTSVATLMTVWGQWNIGRGSIGTLRWLAINLVLVGHFAYGPTSAMQNSAWIFPVCDLVFSLIINILLLLGFGWLYKYAGYIPQGYSKTRAAARLRTKKVGCEMSESESESGSDYDNSSASSDSD